MHCVCERIPECPVNNCHTVVKSLKAATYLVNRVSLWDLSKATLLAKQVNKQIYIYIYFSFYIPRWRKTAPLGLQFHVKYPQHLQPRMLALIKNTFLKKIFLQCLFSFKHAFENSVFFPISFLFFILCTWLCLWICSLFFSHTLALSFSPSHTQTHLDVPFGSTRMLQPCPLSLSSRANKAASQELETQIGRFSQNATKEINQKPKETFVFASSSSFHHPGPASFTNHTWLIAAEFYELA